jgi:hypothetical protein
VKERKKEKKTEELDRLNFGEMGKSGTLVILSRILRFGHRFSAALYSDLVILPIPPSSSISYYDFLLRRGSLPWCCFGVITSWGEVPARSS